MELGVEVKGVKIKETRKEERKEMKRILTVLAVLTLVTGIIVAVDKEELRDELNESKDNEYMQIVGVNESKIAEYQDGKTLTDVHGRRVRLEQYIIAHRDLKQLEFVTYSSRDSGVDTLRGLYTLNKELPEDIRTIGELDPQKWPVGVKTELEKWEPEYYCIDIRTSASNDKGDSVKYEALHGDLYMVEADIPATLGTEYRYDVIYKEAYVKVNDITKVQALHNGGIPKTETVGTIDIYLPKYGSTTKELSNSFTINPGKKEGDPSRLVSINDPTTVENTKVETRWDGTLINEDTMWNSVDEILNKKIDWETTITFADNTQLSHRQLWLKDNGEVLTVRSYINLLLSLRPDNWASKLSELNHEGIWTATEFGERSIDVIWSPSIFIKAATSDVATAK